MTEALHKHDHRTEKKIPKMRFQYQIMDSLGTFNEENQKLLYSPKNMNL